MRKIIVLILFVIILAGLTVLGIRKLKISPQIAILSEGLIVSSPKTSETVTSPLVVSGYVNGGNWFGFEGQVGSVRLIDDVGNLLAQKPLTATTEWTTTTVWFETVLEFAKPVTQTGELIFSNENPSGMPERDKQFILPVKFK